VADAVSGTPAPTISTHVLDTEAGGPAVGVHVTLYKLGEDDRPIRLTQALTDADGRVRDLLERPMSPGVYRLEFRPGAVATGADSADSADEAGATSRFFVRMSVDLHVHDTSRSYHVPLLLAPFSLTTYRGT
jgi:5-hydroxyisourate hydrolase